MRSGCCKTPAGREIYSRSIYHSQQAVEKAMKSCLALAGRIITDDHRVSDRFANTFRGMPAEIVGDAKFLEHQGTRSRYPLFRDPSRSMWIPSRKYTGDDAAGGIGRRIESLCLNWWIFNPPIQTTPTISSVPDVRARLLNRYSALELLLHALVMICQVGSYRWPHLLQSLLKMLHPHLGDVRVDHQPIFLVYAQFAVLLLDLQVVGSAVTGC
ncbi:MAG TPA: HEPN domain-containing protein [Methanosarcinales archaeon]|nr:HEPN domain-containing protein [Methanosarcinales archaeon]